MALRQFRRPCVYCGGGADQKDHVPPRGYFPKPRPSNLITVPSCEACNGSTSDDEEFFLATFMFSYAGVTPAGTALWSEKLERMYRKNHGLRKRIARSLSYANVMTPSGLSLGRRMIVTLDESRCERVVNKIVRGLYYHEYHERLPTDVSVSSRFLQERREIQTVEPFAETLIFGSRQWPGVFEYRFNRVADYPRGSMWVMRFFGKVMFWAISGDLDGARLTLP